MSQQQRSALLSASLADETESTISQVWLNADDLMLSGEQRDGVVAYAGIPYAEPPTGDRRWRAPRALQATPPIRNLGYIGPDCAQPYLPAMREQNVDPTMTAEDCLYLNVWAPADAEPGACPVMVWLHGGGFRIGGASLSLYNGETLAREGVVVVTLNYRLGRLGFLDHPALHDDVDGASDSTTNLGLRDQIEALRFVQRHITTLGGDPDNITLFGESAGGASVLYLMAAREARGLFHKAIVQSGAIDMPEFEQSRMTAIGEAFARHAGLSDPTSADLRALPVETILSTMPQEKTDTMPFIDGELIACSLYRAFERGEVAPVPLLIGSNDNEAGFFPAGFSERVPGLMGDERWARASALTDGYGVGSREAKAAQLATDLFVTLGTRRVARAHATHGYPTYRYAFCYVPPAQRESVFGAIHTAEIPLVFGNALPSEAIPVASRLRQRWVAFARSGVPDVTDAVKWPIYRADDDPMLYMTNAGEQVAPESARERLDYLASLDSLQIN